MMKLVTFTFCAMGAAFAVPSVEAKEIAIDFDSMVSASGSAAAENVSLTDFVSAAADGSGLTVPEARWGDIPPASGPECVDSPYGCGGSSGGSGSGGNGGSVGSGGQPSGGFNPDATFVATVCSGGQCHNVTGQQAALKVSNYIIKKYIKDTGITGYAPLVSFEFPPMARNQILKVLVKLEERIVKTVMTQMKEDMSKIQPMAWETPEMVKKKMSAVRHDEKVLKKWKKEALDEAKRSINFTTMYSHDRTWLFLPNNIKGGAYSDLSDAIEGRDWYQ